MYTNIYMYTPIRRHMALFEDHMDEYERKKAEIWINVFFEELRVLLEEGYFQ